MNVKQIEERIASDRRVKEAAARVEKIDGQRLAAQNELNSGHTALADAEARGQAEVMAGRELDLTPLARLRGKIADAEGLLRVYAAALAEARARHSATMATVREELLVATKANYLRAIREVDDAYAALSARYVAAQELLASVWELEQRPPHARTINPHQLPSAEPGSQQEWRRHMIANGLLDG